MAAEQPYAFHSFAEADYPLRLVLEDGVTGWILWDCRVRSAGAVQVPALGDKLSPGSFLRARIYTATGDVSTYPPD